MPSESSIENAVSKYAREKHKCYVRKFKAPNNRGVPDKLFLTPWGVVFFIEFKKPGGKTSAIQLDEIEQISKRGGKVFIVDNVKHGKAIVETMCKIR